MITLNQLIILYKDIAARHKMVNDFAAVQDFNISADSTHSYPILVVNPTAANLPRTEAGYTSFTTVFDLQVIDLVDKDNSNRMDVLSDTQQILNDVVNEFNTHPYYIDAGIDTISNISFTPLRGVYDGDVDGWKISMELEHPNKLSYCGNPIENLSGFDFTPASVTVVDGINTYDLFPEQTYTCSSLNVSNSNDSYAVDIMGDLELPNINFTDSNGTTTSVPSMEDLVCTPSVCPFLIEHSFLLDGVNETINANEVLTPLASTTQGTWLISLKIINSLSVGNQALIAFGDTDASNDLFLYRPTGTKNLTLISRKSGVEQFALTTIGNNFADNTWYTIAVVQDGVEPKVYVDGVFVGQSFGGTLADKSSWFNNIPLLDNGNIGSRSFNGGGSQLFFEGNIGQTAFLDIAFNQTQITTWHDNGIPLDVQGNYPTEVKGFLNPDSSGNTAQFTILDSINSINFTTVNLEDTDKTTDVPIC